MRMFFLGYLVAAAVWLPSCSAQGSVPADLDTAASGACPASVVARHEAADAVQVFAGGAGSAQGPQNRPGQGLEIKMTPAEGKRIVSADVTVHALSTRARVLASGATPDLTRTFHLAGSDSAPSLSAQVRVANAGAILSVDVLALHYADGTEWQAPRDLACTVRPELYMQVAAAR